ncbi:hypothetical protein EW145_g5438 [Phellinidium pouzarii]|uniref:ATP-dependent RNA helicase n=1 Tax=Phellinidium pouzarii TaxID=167371 RepID=A0A4S4KZZ0_9AGAM|nr:hypothetical protein EW145_g5438 [Phellinidium pouzarii]
MDDGFILNIVEPSAQSVRRTGKAKGGRWTDSPRPVKKARKVGPTHPSEHERLARPTNTSRPVQVVSSLFTYNPEVEVAEAPALSSVIVKPSNAPLTDKSAFSGLGLDPLIVAHLETKMHISNPTSIQREALPPLLSTSSEDTFDRDVFIQSQTGSGKTLSYLLPILQDLLPFGSLSYIDRSIGTLAIVIVPTRELAKQISDVLEVLLTLRLRPQNEGADDASPSARLTRWLVSGLLIGGENRTHEKSRLRKGLPILVSTPGRLLDHLQNTSSFNVGKCRWLVLDEADRLMELGFEESIKGILQALEGRRKLAVQAVEEGKSAEVGGWNWEKRRRTVLCSATMREDVQHLAGTALVKPILVKATELDKPSDVAGSTGDALTKPDVVLATGEKFTPPSQLSQKYIVAPLKLRLVALIALLRLLLAQSQSRQGTKIIVFLSCTDSVDYHWKLLGTSSIDGSSESPEWSSDDEGEGEGDDSPEDKSKKDVAEKISLSSPLLPQTSIYRLHGSLPLKTRLASLKGFASARTKSKDPNSKTNVFSSSILLCTSVASRGLDLPLVRAVVQYDLPTEGGATEYVHRVGRTARVGRGGEAWAFVSPSEQEWVRWIETRIQDKDTSVSETGRRPSLVPASVESVMRGGFGGKGNGYEERATQVQLAFERWVLKQKENGELARRAFQSHMRAYATHPADEKHIFHVRNLHLGHLAKAFALREAPGHLAQQGAGGNSRKLHNTHNTRNNQTHSASSKSKSKSNPIAPVAKPAWRNSHGDTEHDATAERRMQEVVRRQGRLLKQDGVLVARGTAEFQIGGGYDLERLFPQ